MSNISHLYKGNIGLTKEARAGLGKVYKLHRKLFNKFLKAEYPTLGQSKAGFGFPGLGNRAKGPYVDSIDARFIDQLYLKKRPGAIAHDHPAIGTIPQGPRISIDPVMLERGKQEGMFTDRLPSVSTSAGVLAHEMGHDVGTSRLRKHFMSNIPDEDIMQALRRSEANATARNDADVIKHLGDYDADINKFEGGTLPNEAFADTLADDFVAWAQKNKPEQLEFINSTIRKNFLNSSSKHYADIKGQHNAIG